MHDEQSILYNVYSYGFFEGLTLHTAIVEYNPSICDASTSLWCD